MKSIFSDNDVNFMMNHYKDMSYREIANVLGFTEKQIRGKINNMGLTKNRKFNSDYFHIIDNPTKAYYVGLLYADGQVCSNSKTRNYELGISLEIHDKYLLDNLNKELGNVFKINILPACEGYILGNKIYKSEQAVLRVYSKEITTDLINLGIVSRKTLSDIFPKVSYKYFYDFLRGYIDGDGCYYHYKNQVYMHITCATKKPLVQIKDILEKDNINCNIYKETDRKYRLMCTNQEGICNLYNKLYSNNSICMKRKFDIIKPYVEGLTIQ